MNSNIEKMTEDILEKETSVNNVIQNSRSKITNIEEDINKKDEYLQKLSEKEKSMEIINECLIPLNEFVGKCEKDLSEDAFLKNIFEKTKHFKNELTQIEQTRKEKLNQFSDNLNELKNFQKMDTAIHKEIKDYTKKNEMLSMMISKAKST